MRTIGKLVAGGAIPLLALGMAGCGKASPEEELSKAIDAYNTQTEAQMVMSLDINQDALAKFFSSSGVKVTDPGKLAGAIRNMAIVSEARSKDGTPLSKVTDLRKADIGLWLRYSGQNDLLGLLGINREGYLRLDMKKATEVTGIFDGLAYEQQMSGLSSSVPWLRPVLEGKWVKLGTDITSALYDKIASVTSGATGLADLPVKLKTNIMSNSSFSRDGDAIVVKVNLKSAVKQYVSDVRTAMGTSASSELATADAAVNQLKDDATLTVRVKLSDGKLSEVRFDAAELIRSLYPGATEDKAAAELLSAGIPVVFSYKDKTEGLNPPSDFMEISQSDLKSLAPLLGGIA